MESRDEKELIYKAKQNPKYFGELYDRHFKGILNYCFRRVGDFDLANDITSEVFLKAFVNLWRFKWKSIPFSAWLYRIASNEMNQYYRHKSYRAELSSDLNLSQIKVRESLKYEEEKRLAQKQLQDHADFEKTRQIMQKMPVIYQEVLSLRYFEQKSIKEIASILGKKEGTIKSLLSRGLEKIRKEW